MPSFLQSIRKFWAPSTELSGEPLDHWMNLETSQESDWKKYLSRKEYNVMRKEGTEMAGSSVYNQHMPKQGYYACRACGNPLYSYKSKFLSDCGWPAFGEFVENSIETKVDHSFGMKRTEIHCNRCRSHLGHVFAEHHNVQGQQFQERHCVNGVSIRYVDQPLPEGANPRATVMN